MIHLNVIQNSQLTYDLSNTYCNFLHFFQTKGPGEKGPDEDDDEPEVEAGLPAEVPNAIDTVRLTSTISVFKPT